MANYDSANLVKAQVLMNQAFNKAELRYRNPATFLEFVRNREIMLPSHNLVKGRDDRPVEVNYFARTSRALGSARSHDHSGAKGDSAIITPTWVTYADIFSYSLKQADNSVYDLDTEIANEFGNVVGNFAVGLEAAAVSALYTGRTGVNAYARQGSFSATDDVFAITETTNGDRAMQISKSVMDFAGYQGTGYIAFCDSVAYDKFEKQAFQGAGNSSNLSFNFSGVRFVKSIGLDTLLAALGTGYTLGAWIMVPEGMIGALDWIPKQNRAGIETKENVYGSLLNPVDGLVYATHKYEARANGTATNGYTQDVVTQVQVSIDVALAVAPVTTANASPLFACALV